MAKVVIVSGSPHKSSRLYGLIDYSEQVLRCAGIEAQRIEVASLPAEDLILANFASESIVQAQATLASADAVIFASPVYKAAYTGVLKTFIDLIPERGLYGKLSLPLFIGGTIAHLLSIDYALKPVLSVLGARHILGGVYATDAGVTRLENGGYQLADDLKGRLDDSLNQLQDWLQLEQSRQ